MRDRRPGCHAGPVTLSLRRRALGASVLAAGLTLALAPSAYAANPETTITSGPENGALVLPGPVTYTFSADVPGATFQCKVDNGGFAACTTPATYDLPPGGHTFTVRAVDGLMVPDPTPESRIWTVRNVPCEQAGAAYKAAQSEFFLQESKLGKAKTKLQRAKEHGNTNKVKRLKKKLKDIKKARNAAQAAMDAAMAQEHAVC
jgi:hypothetical protein